MQYLSKINYNIDILSNHVNNIAESMLLTKLRIIPKFILTHKELDIIEKILSNQKINIISEEHIYRLLNLEAATNKENKIIFDIKIPIFDKENFKLTRIIPLPINKTQMLKVPKYILYDNKSNVSTIYQT